MFIKELRQKRQLSQEMLAKRCNLSLRTIQRVECGNKVGYASMRALATELDVDLETLEQGINKVETTPDQHNALQSKRFKLQFISALCAISAGLGLQVFLTQKPIIPILQSTTLSFFLVVIGGLGLAICYQRILPVFKELKKIKSQEFNDA